MADFKAGDAVTWHSHGSMAGGTIARKITRDTGAVGRSARGDQDNLRCLERADSGGAAVHKLHALRRA